MQRLERIAFSALLQYNEHNNLGKRGKRMFSNAERVILRRNQLGEVICQLRFPEILMINANPPAQFQEAIRNDYPVYAVRKEMPAPRVTGAPGNFSLENQQPVTNYQFASADGVWRVNLTSTFISLACTKYTCWEDFAKHLDKPLVAFIKTYQPAYFTRVGLRYLNFISRKALHLDDVPYAQLIQPAYLGLLSEEDVQEHTVGRCTVDAEMAIRGGCHIKIHAGPGLVQRKGNTEKEPRFILDQDLFMPGNIPVSQSATALQTVHSQAFSIFRGAITDLLYRALEPEYL